MSTIRGYTRREVERLRQEGTALTSKALDAATTEDVIILGGVASKVSYQSSGTLAGDISFSVNGVNFTTPVAFTATTLASFNTHNALAIKITRTSGAGRMHIAASV